MISNNRTDLPDEQRARVCTQKSNKPPLGRLLSPQRRQSRIESFRKTLRVPRRVPGSLAADFAATKARPSTFLSDRPVTPLARSAYSLHL
jgi:hypothetical protein